jgi:hypothetical protein
MIVSLRFIYRGTAKVLLAKFLVLLRAEEVSFLAWNLVNLLLMALVFLLLRSKGMCLDFKILTSLEEVVFCPSAPWVTVVLFLKLAMTVFLLEMLIRVKTLAMLLLKAYI